MNRAIIFLNGELSNDNLFYKRFISSDDTIFCADGGAKHVFELGLTPQLILGDLDSLAGEIIIYYERRGVPFKKFPKEKDKTDTELLVEYLLEEDKYNEIIIFAALGGRLDHTLGNIFLLERLFSPKCRIRIITPKESLEVIRDQIYLKGIKGKVISLLSISKESNGIFLSGFKYELENGTIAQGSTLGMSNIVKSEEAKIKVKEGRLLLIINN